MKCNITYMKPNGKKDALVRDSSGKPREFANKEKARQFIRNHKFQFVNMKVVPVKEG